MLPQDRDLSMHDLFSDANAPVDNEEAPGDRFHVAATPYEIPLSEARFEGEETGDPLSTLPWVRKKQWVKSVRAFSTQFSESWSAASIRGPPNNFPRYGDLAGSWASSTYNGPEFLEFFYNIPVRLLADSFRIYETFNPGGLIRILGAIECGPEIENSSFQPTWIELWTSDKIVEPKVSRILVPDLPVDELFHRNPRLRPEMRLFRFEYDMMGLGSWCELDAVQLIGFYSPSFQLLERMGRFGHDMFSLLRSDCSYSDLVFEFPDEEDESEGEMGALRVRAHRGIVCARVPVLRTMLTCGMSESISAEHSSISTLSITDYKSSTLRLLLEFIYTGSLSSPLHLIEELIPLYQLADLYLVSDLTSALEEYLTSALMADSVLPVYCASWESMVTPLVLICEDYLIRKLGSVSHLLADEMWTERLEKEQLCRLCRSLALRAREQDEERKRKAREEGEGTNIETAVAGTFAQRRQPGAMFAPGTLPMPTT